MTWNADFTGASYMGAAEYAALVVAEQEHRDRLHAEEKARRERAGPLPPPAPTRIILRIGDEKGNSRPVSS